MAQEILVINYERTKALPRLVFQLSWAYDGWVVGSGARYLLGLTETCRDFDVLIPYEKWDQASLLLPNHARPNTFGGWKVCVDEQQTSVDVWPHSLERFFARALITKPGTHNQYAVQLSTYTTLIAARPGVHRETLTL